MNMKKLRSVFVFALIACLCLSLLAGCGGEASDDSSDVPEAEKVYIIATDTTFAPFEFMDENQQYVGIDIELLAAIAADQGFQYELRPLGFNAAVAAMESGQADAVIAGMSITDVRKESYDFSNPYYDSGVVMAIAAADNTIQSYEDLQGKTVAVKTGTEGATFAESIKDEYGFEIVYFDESPFMYEDVKAGNSVACFEDYPVMGYGISQGNGLKMVTEMERGSSYGFAVLKGNYPELIEMFNAGLANLRANGQYDEILNRYISTGEEAPEDSSSGSSDSSVEESSALESSEDSAAA